MKKLYLFTMLTVLILICFGHEYVLLATKYRLQKGDTLEMHLFVADGFNIEKERPYQKSLTRAFELCTKDSIIDLSMTENGKFPVVNRRVNFDGGGLIHMERDYVRINLDTEKFLNYLRDDHIEDIAAKVDRNKKDQRERYTRYIKSLVHSGNNFEDTLYKKIIGQNFEIILLSNPYQLKTGNVLKARILFMGKPFANKIISARNRTGSAPSILITAKTNINGECSFEITRKGEWFIHSTHMIPCPDSDDSDWESFWTSYSFEIDN